MRILYLCADRGIPLGGTKGASAHVRGLIRALTQLGHEVRVIMGSTADANGMDVPIVSIPSSLAVDALSNVAEARVARAMNHLLANAEMERALVEALDSFQPDVVYERYSPFAAAGALVCSRLGVPHLLEVNAPLAWEGSRYRRQALSEAAEELERAAFAATSCLITVSEELKDTLVGDGVDASRIVVVPNGVDAELFAPEGEPSPLNLEGRIVVGFVGSLKPWHGINVLADGFRKLSADGPYHLLVVGNGPEQKTIRGLERDLPDRITHVEAITHDEVPRYIRSMDIAVAPYPDLERFYYSPLKVLEYMAAGRPVVASAIGQLNDLIETGRTGVLIPPGDTDAFTNAVAKLADNAELRRAMGAAASDEVRRLHLWTHRAKRIISCTGKAA